MASTIVTPPFHSSTIVVWIVALVIVVGLLSTYETANGFHDCIQARHNALERRKKLMFDKHTTLTVEQQQQQHSQRQLFSAPSSTSSCSGGICVGMTNGPHQGGNASYPVNYNGTTGTTVMSWMTVPQLPHRIDDITYYIWTDIFFGDTSPIGQMNQLVPQLLLGNVLNGSSGPPNYIPTWTKQPYKTWMFGSHYFFELYNTTTNTTDAHAAYGSLHPVQPGEILYTKFVLSPGDDDDDEDNVIDVGFKQQKQRMLHPKWTLTMGVFNDDTRVSTLEVPYPYMGMLRGQQQQEEEEDGERAGRQAQQQERRRQSQSSSFSSSSTTTTSSSSWLERPYRHMCINMCWEMYSAIDADHLPSSGSTYRTIIHQPMVPNNDLSSSWPSKQKQQRRQQKQQQHEHNSYSYYNFTTWEQDEGNGQCPSCTVSEHHTIDTQTVIVDISVNE